MALADNDNDWNMKIPIEPTPCLVLVKNISSKTQESTIKDFFSFCGVIKTFEMKKSKDDDHQVAIVYFEKESAAKTATLLSQAVVDDSSIEVEPYFNTAMEAADTTTTTATTTTTTSTEITKETALSEQENKSASRIMAELLAYGYVLTDSVIAKGAEFDEKHHTSTRVNGYLNKMGINLDNLNQKWHQGYSAKEKDDNSNNRRAFTNSSMQNLMNSRASLKFQGFASKIANKVSNVHEEAKRIAAEKKDKSSPGPIRNDDHTSTTATNK
ncbi:uncharacterized protein BX663DRAFT_552771 [Cokeromyces recurvatus]|uniref:uncharacterized protein n=1 Tax=Cokeromyces recurvatus TaxID=90255 RepID=UPI00221EB20B|nr:uncharacterized protein BX663DRAFT_552771 [Cokeromyces recurvatus]KAI7901857.1 hypothetical protein BX663DRAFT_552771 [Cokeromyces recurvatus]